MFTLKLNNNQFTLLKKLKLCHDLEYFTFWILAVKPPHCAGYHTEITRGEKP